MLPEIRSGVTRVVLIGRTSVLKLPNQASWRQFLNGLLANLQESLWWRSTHDRRLCPILWADPLGLIVIMRRAEPFPFDRVVDWDYFNGLPLDAKKENVGVLDGRTVLIDYG